MSRISILIAIAFSFACSDDSRSPQFPDSSSMDVGGGDMRAEADVSAQPDTSVDAGDEVDMQLADAGEDAGVDMGPEEPCPNGICSLQDCIDNGWVPPSNLERDTMPLYRDDTVRLTWEEFFGQPYPGGNSRFLEIEPGKYVTIRFDTNSFRNRSRVMFDNPQGSYPYGSRLVTISQCPGYFGSSPYPGDTECREWKFAIGNMDMTIDETGDRNRCELKSGRTYYMNIVPVDEILPEGSEDLTWRCAIGDTMDETQDNCGALMVTTHEGSL